MTLSVSPLSRSALASNPASHAMPSRSSPVSSINWASERTKNSRPRVSSDGHLRAASSPIDCRCDTSAKAAEQRSSARLSCDRGGSSAGGWAGA
ncbi:hypothetical protein [Porphyrobacter sp. LM 6]|uniref:hypothetical protein n=1 Tax=Porphyrobacter sp. LM 6 TaxID=1896196 RepID=UPI001680DB3C|nr:hypothetical protein [Porphyrobacter sp. LM 6]